MPEIKPFMSKGEVFCIAGQLVMAPLHLYRSRSGATIFRVGSTTLWFDSSGVYTGTEARLIGALAPAFNTVLASYEAAEANRGLPPEDPYYEKDSAGFRQEINSVCALLREALEKIPQEKKRPFLEALQRISREMDALSPGDHIDI